MVDVGRCFFNVLPLCPWCPLVSLLTGRQPPPVMVWLLCVCVYGSTRQETGLHDRQTCAELEKSTPEAIHDPLTRRLYCTQVPGCVRACSFFGGNKQDVL